MKKQAKQAPKKTAITQAVAANNKAKKDKQKKSKAASQGWATRRANEGAKAPLPKDFIRFDNIAFNANTPVDPKPVGIITKNADHIEALTIRLGACIGSLQQKLCDKLGGHAEGSEKKSEVFSGLPILGAQQRTQENLEAALKMIEEMDQLQEVNL